MSLIAIIAISVFLIFLLYASWNQLGGLIGSASSAARRTNKEILKKIAMKTFGAMAALPIILLMFAIWMILLPLAWGAAKWSYEFATGKQKIFATPPTQEREYVPTLRWEDHARVREVPNPLIVKVSGKEGPEWGQWGFAGTTPPKSSVRQKTLYKRFHDKVPTEVFHVAECIENTSLASITSAASRRYHQYSTIHLLQGLPESYSMSMGTNHEKKVAIWYLQTDAQEASQQFISDMEMPPGVSQWFVEIGDQKGVWFDLKPGAWESAWVVPIYDPQYSATFKGGVIPPDGSTPHELAYGAVHRGEEILSDDQLEKSEEIQRLLEAHASAFLRIPCYTLFMEGEKGEILPLKKSVTLSPGVTRFKIGLNAPNKAALQRHHTPATVLIGFKGRGR